jgi:hypothetical protein
LAFALVSSATKDRRPSESGAQSSFFYGSMTPYSVNKVQSRTASEKKKVTPFNPDIESHEIVPPKKAKFIISNVQLADNRSVSQRKTASN